MAKRFTSRNASGLPHACCPPLSLRRLLVVLLSGASKKDLSREGAQSDRRSTSLPRARTVLNIYVDTGFLVSFYVLDANSAQAAAQMKQAKLPILLTAFGELELTSAIALRLFRKELLPSKREAERRRCWRKTLSTVFFP